MLQPSRRWQSLGIAFSSSGAPPQSLPEFSARFPGLSMATLSWNPILRPLRPSCRACLSPPWHAESPASPNLGEPPCPHYPEASCRTVLGHHLEWPSQAGTDMSARSLVNRRQNLPPSRRRNRQMLDSAGESEVRSSKMMLFHPFLPLHPLQPGAMRGDGAAGLKKRFPSNRKGSRCAAGVQRTNHRAPLALSCLYRIAPTSPIRHLVHLLHEI